MVYCLINEWIEKQRMIWFKCNSTTFRDLYDFGVNEYKELLGSRNVPLTSPFTWWMKLILRSLRSKTIKPSLRLHLVFRSQLANYFIYILADYFRINNTTRCEMILCIYFQGTRLKPSSLSNIGYLVEYIHSYGKVYTPEFDEFCSSEMKMSSYPWMER